MPGNEDHLRSRRARTEVCPCCQRFCGLTFHHLIPKKVHRRARYKKHSDKAELQKGVYICRQCHTGIHRTYDEMRLAQDFHSLDRLLQDERLQKHFAWVGKQRIKVKN